ncbi:MAG: tail fiber domain-containing protein [Anaerostipes hadrus]
MSNWTTNTTWIDGGKIYTGSITADKIDVNSIFAKDITATGTITGANLIGATGTFSGQITATEGTIGRYDITSTYLMTNSGSNASGIGGNQAFWAGAEDSNSAPFRVGYDGSFVAENATIYGNIKTGNIGDAGDTAWLVDGHLSVQGTANDTNIYSTWFKFGIGGDYYLKSVSDGVKCYHTMYATDFVADGWVYCSEVHSSGAVVIGADSESFYWAHGYQIARGTSWGGVCVGDDSQQLRLYGSSIWASHSISTSDENLKENFTTLDQYENFYMNLNPIGFNYIGDYDGKKTHFGFGAHKTEDVLESEGYDADKFAVVTHRPLVQEDIEKRFGKDVEVDIETEYGVSYTEFIALNTHMIQKTRKNLIYQAGRIDMQEAIINDLQTRLLQAEKTIKQLTQALA